MTDIILLAGGMLLVGGGLLVTSFVPSAPKNSLVRRIGGDPEPIASEKSPAKGKRRKAFVIPSMAVILAVSAFLSGIPVPMALGLSIFLSAVAKGILSLRDSARRDKMEDQLPAAMDIMGQSVAAGNSMGQAMADMASGTAEPLAGLFRRVADESSAGGDVDDILEQVATEEDMPALAMLAAAVRVQHKSGGSFGPVLASIAEGARDAVRMRKMVKVKTGSVKATAIGMCLLPLLVASGLLYFNESYRQAALFTPEGRMILAMAGMTMAVGMVVISLMLRVKRY